MKKITQYNVKNNVNTTALLVTSALLGTLVMTGCNEKPVDKAIEHAAEETHTLTEHESHEKHHHDEGKHDESKHNHADHDHQDKDGVKHVGKHVHGEAELHAIIDSKQLILELNSPAMNIVGFEHQPNTDEQGKTIETQTRLLNDASKIFSIDGGSCTASKIDVDMPFEEVKEHNHTAGHADAQTTHKEHTHSHNQKEHEHNHKDNHEHHKEGEHSDVKATYHFTCQKSEEIKSISVNVFKNFTGFTKVNMKWINADQQGAKTLTNEDYSIVFE